MKLLNKFFFGEDEITLSDYLWFYGTLIFSIVLTLSVCSIAQFQLGGL